MLYYACVSRFVGNNKRLNKNKLEKKLLPFHNKNNENILLYYIMIIRNIFQVLKIIRKKKVLSTKCRHFLNSLVECKYYGSIRRKMFFFFQITENVT